MSKSILDEIKKSIKTKPILWSHEDSNWLILVDLKNDWLNLVSS